MTDVGFNPPLEKQIAEPSLYRDKLRSVIPQFIYDSYPKFVSFLEAYFDYLNQQDGIVDKIAALKDNSDPTLSEFRSNLLAEFGENVPATTALDQGTLLKILKLFYLSKGNEDSVKAYFRLFLSDENIRVIYPKDNMLITDDGIWDDTNDIYTSFQGLLDESLIVLQDDDYYQIYSYVIKSGQSVNDWGEQFEEAVHPMGWKFFGEVEITEIARFRVNLLSPLFVPGFQTLDNPARVITSDASHLELAKFQNFRMVMNTRVNMNDHDTFDIANNLTAADRVIIEDIADFTIDELINTSTITPIRKGSEIVITTS